MTGPTILHAIANAAGLFCLATAGGLVAALCLCTLGAFKPRDDAGGADAYGDWLADEFTPGPSGRVPGTHNEAGDNKARSSHAANLAHD